MSTHMKDSNDAERLECVLAVDPLHAYVAVAIIQPPCRLLYKMHIHSFLRLMA